MGVICRVANHVRRDGAMQVSTVSVGQNADTMICRCHFSLYAVESLAVSGQCLAV